MAFLTVQQRQTYMKVLGFYKGTIDGKEGPQTRQAYLDLQKRYFLVDKDIDGKYGPNTDTLLRSAYAFVGSKYFKLEEFKCKCGHRYCTGYPAVIDKRLINGLEILRKSCGAPLQITSGLRCKTWNAKQGGASGSRHMTGKAADIQGIPTNTVTKRKAIKILWMEQPGARYTYAQEDNAKYKMGTSVHVDVE